MENENGQTGSNEPEEITAEETGTPGEEIPEEKKAPFYQKNKLLTGGIAALLLVILIIIIRGCFTGNDTGKLMVNISPDETARETEGTVPATPTIPAGQKLYFSIKKKNTTLGVTDISLEIEKEIEGKFIRYKRILFEVEDRFPELKTVIPGVYFTETGTYRVKVFLESEAAFTRTVIVKEGE